MTKEIQKGTVICQSGQPADSIHMIIKGTVRAIYQGGEYLLEKGDVIGLFDIYRENYIFTYTALDDVAIASFPCKKGGISALFSKKPDFAMIAAKSCFKQILNILEVYEFIKYDCSNLYHYITDSYGEYCRLCECHRISPRLLPDLEEIKPLELDDDIPQWLGSYYENMAAVLTQTLPLSKIPYSGFLNGLLLKTGQDVSDIVSVCHIMDYYKSDIAQILMNKNRLDLFDLYVSLLFRLGPDEEDATPVSGDIGRMMLYLEGIHSIDRDLYKSRVDEYKKKLASMEEQGANPSEKKAAGHDNDLQGSLHTILQYSGCEKDVCNEFMKCVDDYKAQIDKNSTDDSSRKLRLHLTKLFYKIYEAAFEKSLQDDDIPIVLKMFFQFGYVDEELAGAENASYLSSIAEHFPSNPEQHIYTAYEWLKAVYNGEKEPSRNEFDLSLIHI